MKFQNKKAIANFTKPLAHSADEVVLRAAEAPPGFEPQGSLRGGLQALRVPLAHVAGGGLDDKSGQVRTSPMQLVVDAVAKTNDFSVFDAHHDQLAHMIMAFKWDAFGRNAFAKEVLGVVFQLGLATSFNLHMLSIQDVSMSAIFGGEEGRGPYLMAILLWIETTLVGTFNLYCELRELRLQGGSYLCSPWNILDLVNISGQLSLNVMLRNRRARELNLAAAVVPMALQHCTDGRPAEHRWQTSRVPTAVEPQPPAPHSERCTPA